MLADNVRALVIAHATSVGPRRSADKTPTRGNAQLVTRERVRFTRPPITRAAPPAEVVPRARRLKVRACYECNTAGHIRRDYSRHVLVTVDGEVDEDALYEAAMLYDDDTCTMTRCVPARPVLRDTASNDIEVESNRACVRAYVRDRVLFCPIEVIFDTAASRSVFKNSKLLRNVVKSHTPRMIGGVQKGAIGIRLDNEGTFRDLGIVGVDVGAAGNNISACQMIDTDKPYR
jgi:hypothetical protein